ncbi:MAG TPA: hypothetical protein VGG07_14205 [Solirubrobacteraceae bacterium]|jgi:hypothetical protein
MSDQERPSWQRPPFENGHTLSVKYGAHSERVIAQLLPDAVSELREALVATGAAPYLIRADDLQLHVTARALVRFQQVDKYLEENGALDDNGRPRPATRWWSATFHALSRGIRELGLSPLARGELMTSLTGVKESQARNALREVQAKYGPPPKPVEGSDGGA